MTIAEQITRAKNDYDAVKEAGVKKGKDEQYDAFWDAFQQNGTRTDYMSAFGACWTPETFRPKYPIRPTTAYFMFFHNGAQGIKIEDFVDFCKKNNVVLDYSECTNAEYGIGCLLSKHFGELNFSNCTSLRSLFYGHHTWGAAGYSVETIDKFISSENTVFADNTFQQAVNLANITFEGVIATNINFSYNTKLTKASIQSIAAALSTTSSGKSITFSLDHIRKTFATEDQAYGDETDEWMDLVWSRQNWTINLW